MEITSGSRGVDSENRCKIFEKRLTKAIKSDTIWDEKKLHVPRPGDFLAVHSCDRSDRYVIWQGLFEKM